MITKSKITITINNNNIAILEKYCNDNFINKSKLINHIINKLQAPQNF